MRAVVASIADYCVMCVYMYINLMYVCRSVISIGDSAFQSSGLRSVSVPSSVTFIESVTIREEKII
jgi:hypothetical protein